MKMYFCQGFVRELPRMSHAHDYAGCGSFEYNNETVKYAVKLIKTSLPYFRVKLSCVCLMFAYRKKIMTCCDLMVTYSHPKMTYSYPKVT